MVSQFEIITKKKKKWWPKGSLGGSCRQIRPYFIKVPFAFPKFVRKSVFN